MEIVRSVAHEYGWPDFQPESRSITKVDPRIFDSLVGEYKSPFGVFTVTREGDGLFAASDRQPKTRLYPASEREYFLTVAKVSVTFGVDAMEMVLHQDGHDVVAKRIR